MAQQQPQQRRLVAAILMLLLLSLCCLAHLGAAASAASTGRRDDGAATALDKPAGQEAARGFTVTTAEERGRGPVRVAMEVDMEDYAGYGPNGRHNPQAPHP